MIEKNRFWCQWNYKNKLYYFLVSGFSKSNLSRNIKNWFQNGRLGANKSNDCAKMNDVESNREVFYIKADNREWKLMQTVRIIQNIGTAPSTISQWRVTANSLFLEAPSWTPRTVHFDPWSSTIDSTRHQNLLLAILCRWKESDEEMDTSSSHLSNGFLFSDTCIILFNDYFIMILVLNLKLSLNQNF